MSKVKDYQVQKMQSGTWKLTCKWLPREPISCYLWL